MEMKKLGRGTDQSNNPYHTSKEIRDKTSMQRSELCDYSATYIVIKGTITVENRNRKNRNLWLYQLRTTLHLLLVYQRSKKF